MNVSCNGANFVAREIDYSMTEGWMQGDNAANQWYAPLETFEERFENLLNHVKTLGFRSMDLWVAHLNWKWAGSQHIKTAKRLCNSMGVSIASYAGPFGDTEQELRQSCRVIKEMGSNLLGGFTGLLDTDPELLGRILEEEDCVFGLENHPEKSSDEILRKINGTKEDRVGLCIDTGWMGLSGMDLLKELPILLPRLKHLHLKDILNRDGHNTCALGAGILPMREVFQFLKKQNYSGGISIEHEPEDRDPSEELKESLIRLKEWEENL